ncbi:hypothetical protein EXIGLDRAFT_462286 [Exidia glandulosa HHB12029]|uniref:Uncharacterized protein n=1 Tax=Exidia glandulosa HHB12029 TaxID=1314781 RepID=A0A165K301_EXIGL|nr:hypothetical protein EXIGLDRAFT_462286 [Exidia glandulosa HHB12029]
MIFRLHHHGLHPFRSPCTPTCPHSSRGDAHDYLPNSSRADPISTPSPKSASGTTSESSCHHHRSHSPGVGKELTQGPKHPPSLVHPLHPPQIGHCLLSSSLASRRLIAWCGRGGMGRTARTDVASAMRMRRRILNLLWRLPVWSDEKELQGWLYTVTRVGVRAGFTGNGMDSDSDMSDCRARK